MEPSTNRFTRFFPNIETVPFTDEEACSILSITKGCFCRATKQGLVQKSVAIHYRFDVSFSFLNLFDIYEYALRSNFFFLNYGTNPEASELVYGLIDELAFNIDNCLSSNSPLQVARLQKDLEIFCEDNHKKWKEYWILGGNPFSAAECSAIALKSWCDLFDKTMGLINPPAEYLGDYSERRFPLNAAVF